VTEICTNGDQLFGVVDQWGNARATLELHPFDGEPGEAVRVTMAVDDYPATVVTIGGVRGVQRRPVQKGNAIQLAHIPGGSRP
jgi:hypothetical protein